MVVIEAVLARYFPSAPRLHSSSRTDTGVHALGMVAHFEVPSAEFKMTTRKLALALNAWLPEDIRVLAASRVAKDFHARFDAAACHKEILFLLTVKANVTTLCPCSKAIAAYGAHNQRGEVTVQIRSRKAVWIVCW